MGSKWSSNDDKPDGDVNSGYEAFFHLKDPPPVVEVEEVERNSLETWVNSRGELAEGQQLFTPISTPTLPSYPSENSFLRYSFNGNEADITPGDQLRSQLTSAADSLFDRQFERANHQWQQHSRSSTVSNSPSTAYRRGSTPTGRVANGFQPSPNRRLPNDNSRHRRLVLKRSQTSSDFPDLNATPIPKSASGQDHHRPRLTGKMADSTSKGSLMKNRSQSVQYGEPLVLHSTKTRVASSEDLTTADCEKPPHHPQRRLSNVKKVGSSRLLSPPQINMIRAVWNQLLATKGATGVGGILFQRMCFKRASVKDVFMEVEPGEKYPNHDVMMKTHAKLMAEVIDRVMQNLEALETLDSWLEDIGRAHGHLFEVGFAPQLWDLFMESFADCATREWGEKNKRTEDARVAWMIIITRITEKVKQGFQEQRKKPRPK